MKKSLFLLALLLAANFASKAAPGDTTWVQGNITNLEWYNNYDTTIAFPAGSTGTTYRKVYMIFTLGKHVCPGYTYSTGSVPWCADWDYTVLNYLMTPAGDTVELSRLITPYANAGGSLPNIPYSWTDRYIYDVTDYAMLMHDTATVRILYSGYSGGFTANVKFAFIEGTPERNVTGIKRLWTGSYSYGDTSGGDANDINTHFTADSETAPSGTQSATLKFTVTGHGSDANYCNEFCSHNYDVMLNGSAISTTTIWRDNCGANELYPQSGTWLLQRANWCPGALVYPYYHNLPGITDGTSYTVGLQFDPYISSGGAIYTTEGILFYYGGMNKTLDASLEDIISPTDYEGHFRENPLAGTPVIRVRNSGSTAISSIKFQYNVDDSATPSTYTWTGTLASMTDTDISLPEPPGLRSASGDTIRHSFIVKILQVNGTTDADTTNNTLSSHFLSAPQWPNSFIIYFRTNNETDALGKCETNWQIFDAFGSVVAQRTEGNINTTYVDTVTVAPGWYKMVVSDGSCDGLNWWAWGGSYTSGYIRVRKESASVLIPLNGDQYTGEYNNDFGCGFTQYFTVASPLDVINLPSTDVALTAYPNPAQDQVNIELSGLQNVDGTLRIVDMLGRTVLQQHCSQALQSVSTAQLANGVYNVLYSDKANTANVLRTRLVITK